MRQDAIASAKQSLLSAQDSALDSALGQAYDAGVADAPPVVSPDDQTPFSQADIDAAVQKVTDADGAAMSALQDKVDLDAKELQAVRDAVSKSLQDALAALGVTGGGVQPAPAPAQS